MWSILREVSLFFNSSPKCQKCFEEVLCRSTPDTDRRKLVDLCQTRWVACNDALSVFLKLYPAVLETPTIISTSTGWNADSSSRAFSFLNNITCFSFIAAFVLTSNILVYTGTAPLATSLQKKALDIVKAYQSIRAVFDTVQNVREYIDEYLGEWFKAAVDLAQSVNVEPSICLVFVRDKHTVIILLQQNHKANCNYSIP